MSRKRRRIKSPSVFQNLSGTPHEVWPQGAIHHGVRIALLVAIAVTLAILFPKESRRTVARYQVGEVADQDVVAEIGFDVPKTPSELESERAEAEAAVPPKFSYHGEALDSMRAKLNRFFDQLGEAADEGGQGAVEQVLRRNALVTLVDQADALLDPATRRALRTAAMDVIRELMPTALDRADASQVTEGGRIEVEYPSTGEVNSVPVSQLYWGLEFYARVGDMIDPGNPELRNILHLIIIGFFESPYVLDEGATAAARENARATVPVLRGNVVAGEVIVRKGDRIGPAEEATLTAYEGAMQSQGLLRTEWDWRGLLGGLLLDLLLLSVYGFLLFFFRREVYANFRWVLLQAILILVYFFAAWGIADQTLPPVLLPIAFTVLPVAVLWDGRMALILALTLGVLTGVQPPFNQSVVRVVTLVGGGAAALSARAVRRRSQTWIFIALITLGYALAITAAALLGWVPGGSAPAFVVFAGGNATASAILAMGFMPVFEWFTGITTDQTLLEWADPNRPLLKRLSLEASGTYAHTISVANLAESAATAIGANGLLARVGIYYHDVGKLLKPQHFVENQPGGRNPHDKLKPHTSAAIVREHVLEGEKMARDEGVPDIVARFIPEHHGTQLIGFFYEKAKEESEEPPNPDDFRYPGPKPRSKETAIAMLADSVESATRALQDPSEDRVRDLVGSIVDSKIRDGQLSESPLTLREVKLIQEQFVKVLGGMYHHRLDYPATRHLTEVKKDGGSEPDSDRAQAPSAGGDEGEGNGPRASSSGQEEPLPHSPNAESPPSSSGDEG